MALIKSLLYEYYVQKRENNTKTKITDFTIFNLVDLSQKRNFFRREECPQRPSRFLSRTSHNSAKLPCFRYWKKLEIRI